jgi:hypothetical protein
MPQLSCYRFSGFELPPALEARRIDARRDARHRAREAELASMSCGTLGCPRPCNAWPNASVRGLFSAMASAQFGATSASERCGIGSRRSQWGAAHRRGAPNFSTAQTSISTIFL